VKEVILGEEEDVQGSPRKAFIKEVHPEYFALVYRRYRGQQATPYDCTWYQTSRGLKTIDEERFWKSTRKYK